MPRSYALLLALVAAVAGCGAGWHRLDDLTPRPLPRRVQVQVWQGDQVTLLHGVALEPDTLGGVPFMMAPTCESCRVQVALETVDSLRVGSRERGFLRSVGLVFLISGVLGYLFQGIGGN